jgi:hypothetical protein
LRASALVAAYLVERGPPLRIAQPQPETRGHRGEPAEGLPATDAGAGRGQPAPTIEGLKIPGVWVTASSDLCTANDREVAREKFTACVNGSGSMPDRLGRPDVPVDIAYRVFQWPEPATGLAPAALLALIAGFRVTPVTG